MVHVSIFDTGTEKVHSNNVIKPSYVNHHNWQLVNYKILTLVGPAGFEPNLPYKNDTNMILIY